MTIPADDLQPGSGHGHVVPVPLGMTIDEAWAEVVLMGRLRAVEHTDQRWAFILCDPEECGCVTNTMRPN